MGKRLIFFTLCCVWLATAQTTLDKIVAIVDKEIITLSDLNFTVQQVAIQNRLDPSSPELQNQVLDGMINDKLILAQAILDSVEVTDDDKKSIERRIFELQLEHRDLDEVVTRLSSELNVDQLMMRRLKLRKLRLKDQISLLKSELIPDLDA